MVIDEATQAGPDAAWLALHGERESLERALSLALARQRFGTDAGDVTQAHADEADLLVSLDRIMTRIRAAEYRRRPGARQW